MADLQYAPMLRNGTSVRGCTSGTQLTRHAVRGAPSRWSARTDQSGRAARTVWLAGTPWRREGARPAPPCRIWTRQVDPDADGRACLLGITEQIARIGRTNHQILTADRTNRDRLSRTWPASLPGAVRGRPGAVWALSLWTCRRPATRSANPSISSHRHLAARSTSQVGCDRRRRYCGCSPAGQPPRAPGRRWRRRALTMAAAPDTAAPSSVVRGDRVGTSTKPGALGVMAVPMIARAAKPTPATKGIS